MASAGCIHTVAISWILTVSCTFIKWISTFRNIHDTIQGQGQRQQPPPSFEADIQTHVLRSLYHWMSVWWHTGKSHHNHAKHRAVSLTQLIFSLPSLLHFLCHVFLYLPPHCLPESVCEWAAQVGFQGGWAPTAPGSDWSRSPWGRLPSTQPPVELQPPERQWDNHKYGKNKKEAWEP